MITSASDIRVPELLAWAVTLADNCSVPIQNDRDFVTFADSDVIAQCERPLFGLHLYKAQRKAGHPIGGSVKLPLEWMRVTEWRSWYSSWNEVEHG